MLAIKTVSAVMAQLAVSASIQDMHNFCWKLVETCSATGQQIKFAVSNRTMVHPSTVQLTGNFMLVWAWAHATNKELLQTAVDAQTGGNPASLCQHPQTPRFARTRTPIGRAKFNRSCSGLSKGVQVRTPILTTTWVRLSLAETCRTMWTQWTTKLHSVPRTM